MESQSLTKLSVSKLKALALYKGVSIKGCLEKDEIISALRAGGVADGDSVPDTAPAATPAAAPPAKPSTAAAGAAAGGALDEGWAFDDPLLPDAPSRPSKFARFSTAAAKAGATPATEKAAEPERKGLKFFQLKKGQRQEVARAVAERKLPPPPVPTCPGGAKVVEARPAGCELNGLPIAKLQAIAKDHDVKIEGCLEKEDIISALLAKGVTDAKPKPKIVAPPPKKAVPPVPQVAMSPQAYYAQKNAELNERWKQFLEIYKRLKPKFFQGERWQIFQGFPLWAHEDGDERTAYMHASNQIGNPTIIEILSIGRTRLRVRATRWNAMTRSMIGTEPAGWMDVAMVVDEEEKLLMRPYDPQGMYVQTETGQEPVLMTRRTCLQEKLRIHPEMGAGLHLTATPAGMQVDDIDPQPGQPGLAVGDLIVGIGGINVVGLPDTQAVQEAFGAAFVDGAELEIAA